MASLHHLLLPLLLSSLSLLTVHAAITSQESNCTNDFYVLEKELLSRSRNRYNLTKAFFPSRDANPVVIRVTYIFEGPNSTNETWFWTESLFYVIQPLEIFQFTSLFFSDLPYRKQEVTVTLGADCIDTEKEYLMILTQRVSSLCLKDDAKTLSSIPLSSFVFHILFSPTVKTLLPVSHYFAYISLTAPQSRLLCSGS